MDAIPWGTDIGPLWVQNESRSIGPSTPTPLHSPFWNCHQSTGIPSLFSLGEPSIFISSSWVQPFSRSTLTSTDRNKSISQTQNLSKSSALELQFYVLQHKSPKTFEDGEFRQKHRISYLFWRIKHKTQIEILIKYFALHTKGMKSNRKNPVQKSFFVEMVNLLFKKKKKLNIRTC